MALVLNHQTATEFGERFWRRVQEVFSGGDKMEYARLLYWLVERITAGDITDAGARITFNSTFGRTLNATQWTTLRTTRINPAHDRYAAMLAEGSL